MRADDTAGNGLGASGFSRWHFRLGLLISAAAASVTAGCSAASGDDGTKKPGSGNGGAASAGTGSLNLGGGSAGVGITLGGSKQGRLEDLPG